MSVVAFLVSGVVFGASAGLSPGPLLTLVIRETLRHGTKEGLKVAAAPLLTDAPIIALSLLVLARLENARLVLGCLSLAGALYLAWLSFESLAFKGVAPQTIPRPPRSWTKGVITNLANPSPYVFWFTIGGPTTLKAASAGLEAVVFFLFAFYAVLIGSKAAVALAVGRSRFFLKSGIYIFVIRLLGGVLLVYAGIFLSDGLHYLQIY